MRLTSELRQRAQDHLAAFPVQRLEDPSLRPAAVALVLLGDDAGTACFAITRRAPRLSRHGGQWALPGGRLDPGETAEQCALRELHEELGISLGPESVLGALDDYPTRSGFRITPVVAWGGEGLRLAPDPGEVAAAHLVALGDLMAPELPHLHSIPESDRPVLSLPLLGTHIHAPTAAIVYQLREVVLAGRATRVAHFEQPVFAWR